MKVCLVGLGAIGGQLAARLAPAHAAGALHLSALARGATLAAVRADGLVVRDGAASHAVPLAVDDDAGALGVQDLVVLAVKGPALTAAGPSLADAVGRLCGPDTRLMTAMNGLPWWFFDGLPGPCRGLRLTSVDPDGRWHARVAPARVLGAVLHLNCRSPAPGVVETGQGRGIVLGRATADDGAGADDPVLAALAAALADGGLEVTRSPLIQRDVWFKLWGNMTMNPVSALTGATADRVLDDDLVRGFVSAVMREARTLGAAFGVPIEQAPEARHAVTRRLGAFKTSMLQDREAGRALEIDALLGAVREVAGHLGQPTPFLDALLGLTRLMAREHGLYPAAASAADTAAPATPAAPA